MRKSRFRGDRLRSATDVSTDTSVTGQPSHVAIAIADSPRVVAHGAINQPETVGPHISHRSSEPVIMNVDTAPVVAPDASPPAPKVNVVVKR